MAEENVQPVPCVFLVGIRLVANVWKELPSYSKSKKEYAYTILDVTGNVNDDTVKAINDNDGIIFVRVI